MSDERGGMSAEGTEVTTETEEPKWWERAADWLERRELTANGSRLTAGENGDSPPERLRRTQRGTVPIFGGRG
jgi:hypothetical protein